MQQIFLLLGYADTDILSGSYESFVDWCQYLHPPTFSFVIKAALLLLIPAAFAQAAILQGNVSRLGQSVSVLTGALLAAACPIPEMHHLPHVKAWLFAMSVLTIISIPAVLPKSVLSGLNIQKKAAFIIYSVLLLLLLIQLLGGNY